MEIPQCADTDPKSETNYKNENARLRQQINVLMGKVQQAENERDSLRLTKEKQLEWMKEELRSLRSGLYSAQEKLQQWESGLEDGSGNQNATEKRGSVIRSGHVPNSTDDTLGHSPLQRDMRSEVNGRSLEISYVHSVTQAQTPKKRVPPPAPPFQKFKEPVVVQERRWTRASSSVGGYERMPEPSSSGQITRYNVIVHRKQNDVEQAKDEDFNERPDMRRSCRIPAGPSSSICSITSNILPPGFHISCQYCDKKFRYKKLLPYHIQSVHADQLENPGSVPVVAHWKCNFCPKIFEEEILLKLHYNFKHAQNHNGDREPGTSIKNLRERERAANKAKKFKCPLCPNKFYTHQGSLKAHYDITHNGKRWICSFCSQGFKSSRWTRTHEKKKCPCRPGKRR